MLRVRRSMITSCEVAKVISVPKRKQYFRPPMLSFPNENYEKNHCPPSKLLNATSASFSTIRSIPLIIDNKRHDELSIMPQNRILLHRHQQNRPYWFLPTSLKELEIRIRAHNGWYADVSHQLSKNVNVKLFQPDSQNETTMVYNQTHLEGIQSKLLETRNRNKQRWSTFRIWNERRRLQWKLRKWIASKRYANVKAAFVHHSKIYYGNLISKYDGRKSDWLAKYNHRNNYDWVYNYYNQKSSIMQNTIRQSKNTSKQALIDVTTTMVQSSTKLQNKIQTAMNKKINQMIIAGQRYRYTVQPIQLTEYALPSWFCSKTGRPVTSQDETGRFVNPWMSISTDGVQSLSTLVQWRLERFLRQYNEIGWYIMLPEILRYYLIPGNSAAAKSLLPNSSTQTTPKDDTRSTINDYQTHSKPAPQCKNTIHETSYVASSLFNYHEINSDVTDISTNEIKLTWIGHNTCLVQNGSITILTDPIFSHRASPFKDFIGMARDVPPSLSLEELPPIDVVLISHDHYDHLDKASCQQLHTFGKVQKWIVPLGISNWLQEKASIPAENIIELEWWESVQLQKEKGDGNDNVVWQIANRQRLSDCPTHPALLHDDNTNVSNDGRKKMWVSCLPVQHWSGRTLFDRNYRLWCSFAVFFEHYRYNNKNNNFEVGCRSKFFFGGDTALPRTFPLFQQIRDFVGGSIDLAALPIGAYEPHFLSGDAHMNPEEALYVHQVLNSKQSIGIHWGTFPLSEEPMSEPPLRLQQATDNVGIGDAFTTLPIGASIIVECTPPPQKVDKQPLNDPGENVPDVENTDDDDQFHDTAAAR